MDKPVLSKVQLEIIKIYTSLAKKHRIHPSLVAMKNAGASREKIRHHFGTFVYLRQLSKQLNPRAFDSVIDEDIFTPNRHKKVQDVVKNIQRFFITTAVTGSTVDKNFLKNIDAYCKKNKAQALFLLSSDPASNSGFAIDPILKDRNIVFSELQLNSNVFISTIKLSAKHVDPITSLGRIGQRDGSFIYASPKQRLRMVPTSNNKLPHAIMTTGACTKPNYGTSRYMSERTAYIAEYDHVMGGIIVEIKDSKIYHFRQVQADKHGSFIDLGNFYKNGQHSKVKAEAFVIGDYHVGDTDPKVEKNWLEIIEAVGVKNIVFHDLFNGKFNNHHDVNKSITRSVLAGLDRIRLDKELAMTAAVLNKYAEKAKLYIVKSNHDEVLDRYLEEGRYLQDPINHVLALELAAAKAKGADCLKYGVEKFGLNKSANIKWLSRDEDFKIARIELGSHGDKGSNGSRGSLRAMENAYGMSVSGHSHVPEILRGAWSVGTSTYLKLDYNQGPSSWLNTSCLVYANGSRQLINSINGEWKL